MSAITGTGLDDKLVGTTGDDVMDGGAGKDRLNGGDGNDTMSGGDGNDYVCGDRGNDTLYGNAGNDTLVGDAGDDVIFGGDGNDGVFGGGNDDTIFGESGNDTLYGDGGNDTIDGGLGDDKIFGGAGNDTLIYVVGQGADQIQGNAGTDTFRLMMNSADVAGVRGDIGDFSRWLEGQIADAGGTAAHAARATAQAFDFASLGISVASVESFEVYVDGIAVSLGDILNSAPVAEAEVGMTAREDAIVQGTIVATDADNDALAYELVTGPAHGTVVLDATTGAYVYTPDANFSGADGFLVRVSDTAGATVEQQVNLEIAATADAPVLAASATEPADGEAVTRIAGAEAGGSKGGTEVGLDITAALTDLDGSEQLSLRISGMPADATLSAGTDLGNGTWALTDADLPGLTANFSSAGDYTLEVTATATEADGSTATTSRSVAVSIEAPSLDDIIPGGNGNDVHDGGAGHDLVDYSGSGVGVWVDLGIGLAAGQGFDQLHNVEGAIGSQYGDALFGSNGDDTFFGGDGGDAIYGFGGNDTIDGGAGNDELHGFSGDDVIIGGSGNDGVYGGDGNDRLIGSQGNDRLDGGNGTDTVDYSGATSGVEVDLKSNKADGASIGRDHITNVENVVGTAHSDEITGSTAANTLDGGGGNDILRGYRGADTLTGGTGADTFVFEKSDVVSGRTHYGVDTITDFGAGDRLDFESLLNGTKYKDLADVVRLTETAGGTMVAVDVGGSTGLTDVVFLDGVFDLDLDFLDGNGQIIV